MKLSQLLCLVTALALASQGFAQVHNERGDAGDLPSTAQDAGASGQALTNILGSAGNNDADMYAITINDPANFLATTDEANGGSATLDTQLWLFDADGYGILANDDTAPAATDFHSTLLPTADDGTGATIPGPGLYYIAVSGYNNDPTSAAGHIFTQASFTETSGPDGPGAGSPVSAWDAGDLESTGNYDILLSGTKGVPEPATLGLLGLGVLAMIRRRR